MRAFSSVASITLHVGLGAAVLFGTAKAGLTEGEAVRLAEALPPPVFDADRRLRRVDELER